MNAVAETTTPFVPLLLLTACGGAPGALAPSGMGALTDVEARRWAAETQPGGNQEIRFRFVFTDSAAGKVKELIEEEGNPSLKLRVFVTGGGCSGFQYGFTFDEEVNEDDTTMEKNGVTLLIDPMSYQYLVGAEIDYSEGLEGSQFVIRNPNATSTCGCGSSFSA